MKKTILFPTDFSASSSKAFRYTLLMADHIDASIKVVHVAFPELEAVSFTTSRRPLPLLVNLRKKAKKFIDSEVRKNLEKLHNTPMVTADIVFGEPSERIIQTANEESVDFITMGTRGENKSMIEKLLGSVATAVVEKSNGPVLVIPEHAEWKRDNKIAYATNLSDDDPYEIWKAIRLIDPQCSNLHLVHILMPRESRKDIEVKMEKIKKMQSFFTDQHSELNMEFHLIPNGSLEKGLDSFIKKHQPNLLVMYQSRHSFWNRILFSSNTKIIAAHTKLPLLIQKKD